jgi:hypothetical protein
MSARYTIVQGDPSTHKSQALDLTLRNLQAAPEITKARYPKYYEVSPFGPPMLFFAQEVATEQFIGMGTVYPVELWIKGEAVRGGISADFVVDQGHRALGPALALQRAMNDALLANGLHFAYGLPNRFSDPVTARVGYAEVGQLTRFVKILKARALARTFADRPAVARLVSTFGRFAADPVLSAMSRERLYRRRAQVRAEHVTHFDQRFRAVFDEMSRQHPITPRRTPEILNWKYELSREIDPAGRHSILALTERDANVLGYVVYTTIDDVRYVEDVGFMPSRSALDVVLSEFILDARGRGIEAISVTHLATESLFTRRLGSFGFARRPEASRLRVFAPKPASFAVDLLDRNNWFFLGGDSDI